MCLHSGGSFLPPGATFHQHDLQPFSFLRSQLTVPFSLASPDPSPEASPPTPRPAYLLLFPMSVCFYVYCQSLHKGRGVCLSRPCWIPRAQKNACPLAGDGWTDGQIAHLHSSTPKPTPTSAPASPSLPSPASHSSCFSGRLPSERHLCLISLFLSAF